ncbi:hypothetical protein, partial [Klebsiella pneumoniae]|uniref:hypothetical protein n=1 Tax=Klebsiella pneumoniae TaxID=573 RepID=UPI001953481A
MIKYYMPDAFDVGHCGCSANHAIDFAVAQQIDEVITGALVDRSGNRAPQLGIHMLQRSRQ